MNRRWLFWIALLGTGLTLCVIVLGAWTRLRDAGLGCPDWPGCYGFLLPPEAAEQVAHANRAFPDAPLIQERAWPEMIHRYFATSLGMLAIVMLVMAWVQRVSARREIAEQAPPLGLIAGLLVLIIVQGLFGMWTVTLKLWPQVVTAHLLGGMATISLMWLVVLRCGWTKPLVRLATIPWRWAALALVVVVLQIALGGWTTSNYAALACPDFPTCQTQWWPPADFARGFDITQPVGPSYLGGLMNHDGRVAIHLSHRLGALLVLGVVGGLAVALLWSRDGVLRGLGFMLLLLLAIQWTLGIANVVFTLPRSVAVAHNGVAAVLLVTLVSVNYRLFLHRRLPQVVHS